MLRGASQWLALAHRRLLAGQRGPGPRAARLLLLLQAQRAPARPLSNRSFRESIERIKVRAAD